MKKHPRMHGEYGIPVSAFNAQWETPPYARGILNRKYCRSVQAGNTPVCTGNTLLGLVSGLLDWKHPRMHGEYEAEKPVEK